MLGEDGVLCCRVFVGLITAACGSLTLSTHAFNVPTSPKKHQKPVPVVWGLKLFLSLS